MTTKVNKGYDPDTDFDHFLTALREQQDMEWKWLLDHLRELVLPWIRKKDGRLPADTIVSEAYFVEEVFLQSLIKFYELFKTGTFENLSQFRGLMFRIAELKLKEAYRKHQRDRLIYFPGQYLQADQKAAASLMEEELNQQELVKKLEKQLSHLEVIDQEIILRFIRGERLKDIAKDLAIEEASCRKRKQRALEQLRKLLPQTLTNF